MPLYFFHIRDGRDWPDPTGTLLPDADTAGIQAVVTAGALIEDLGARFWNGADWQMDVVDEHGGAVCHLHVTGTVGAP